MSLFLCFRVEYDYLCLLNVFNFHVLQAFPWIETCWQKTSKYALVVDNDDVQLILMVVGYLRRIYSGTNALNMSHAYEQKVP